MGESTVTSALETLRRLQPFDDLQAGLVERFADAMSVRALDVGDTLIAQGDTGEALYVVVEGRLRVEYSNDSGEVSRLSTLEAGSLVGEVQLVVGGTRTASVVAETAGSVLRLDRESFDRIVEEFPGARDRLADIVTERLRLGQLGRLLPSLLGEFDEELFEELCGELSWVSLRRGQTLFREGDASDAWYVLTSGRLSVHGDDGTRGEIGRGESFGEMGILLGRPRTRTVVAMRDTELARIPARVFEELLPRWPRVLFAITGLLSRRLLQPAGRPGAAAGAANIGLLPVSSAVDAVGFAAELEAAFAGLGDVLNVGAPLLSELGLVPSPKTTAPDHPAWMRFATWFEEQQALHPFVLLQGDAARSTWSERALRASDHVVVLARPGDFGDTPALDDDYLAGLRADCPGLRITLVLLHPASVVLPTDTARWLEHHRFDGHVHVREGNAGDASRLARILTGRSVGLVLGGGGARGAAHLGVVRALREGGVPIDAVGGASAGSIAGALVGMELDYEDAVARVERAMANRPFREYTLPFISLVAGSRLEHSARELFADLRAEDLWIDYFAVSSNLTTAELLVHDEGPLWLATRASGSLPGVVPPVEHGDSLLVDGGVIDNLPVATMRARRGGRVVAVSVSPKEDVPRPTGGLPSPWTILADRVRPGGRRLEYPGLFPILMRTTTLASSSRQEAAARDADLLFEPPTDRWGLLDFEATRAIAEAAYQYASDALEAFDRDGSSSQIDPDRARR